MGHRVAKPDRPAHRQRLESDPLGTNRPAASCGQAQPLFQPHAPVLRPAGRADFGPARPRTVVRTPMSQIRTPKKLIEVALPLDDINAASAREKSIRHGHPSTLHLWWARRPLAAARAVIFAQMVNDPGGERGYYAGKTRAQADAEREELFQILRDLVKWENTNNEEVLARARAAIAKSWRETCELNKGKPGFDPEVLPAFHDPFAGGGALPLEAQRLGLESHASDLNPVAVTINKAMIEIPPRFAGRAPVGPQIEAERGTKRATKNAFEDWSGARGLAEDVRRYGAWMREQAQQRIGHLYPTVTITPEMIAASAGPVS